MFSLFTGGGCNCKGVCIGDCKDGVYGGVEFTTGSILVGICILIFMFAIL